MAEWAVQQADTGKQTSAEPSAAIRRTPSLGADLAGRIGNQARLRRLSAAPAQAQAKLEIGAVDDPLEREADTAADAVMRMSPASPPASDDESPGGCPSCRAQRAVRRTAAASAPAGGAPPIVHQALSGAGRTLDASVKTHMEAAFDADFGAVRIHTDGLAARSAAAIGAHAYTLGSDIVFAAGQYQPASTSGRRLLAHELAHTLQQSGGTNGSVRRMVTTPSAGAAVEVADHINSFCKGSAAASGTNVVPAAGACAAKAGPGCDCACSAMQNPARTFTISPEPCNVLMATEPMARGGTATFPISSVWPNTSKPACVAAVQITIPKAGSAMEFGAFDAKGTASWYPTWRILAHELCGHGVLCQTYAGGPGNRQKHDDTIDTENQIAGAPMRGHFTDKPRQGESFTNKVGDQSKVAFVLTDGWHFEAP